MIILSIVVTTDQAAYHCIAKEDPSARDTYPYGPLAEPTISGFAHKEMELWLLSHSVLRNPCAFNAVPVQFLIDGATTPQYVVAEITQENLRQSVPGAVQLNLHGFACIAADLLEVLAQLNWSQFVHLSQTQPSKTRRVLSLANLLPALRAVCSDPKLRKKCLLVERACENAILACCSPFGIGTFFSPALLLTQKGSLPQYCHVDRPHAHEYSGVIAVNTRSMDFRLDRQEPCYVKQQLEVKDGIHQANLFEASRCHRGAADSGDSQVVLTLCPDSEKPRSVEIVSIGLHFYAGHGLNRTPKDLAACHNEPGDNYGIHPNARCLSMEELHTSMCGLSLV